MLGCSVKWDENAQIYYINASETSLQNSFAKGTDINVYVNNQLVEFPDGQKPVLIDGRLLTPCREVVEALGYTYEWDETNQTVRITSNLTILIHKLRP